MWPFGEGRGINHIQFQTVQNPSTVFLRCDKTSFQYMPSMTLTWVCATSQRKSKLSLYSRKQFRMPWISKRWGPCSLQVLHGSLHLSPLSNPENGESSPGTKIWVRCQSATSWVRKQTYQLQYHLSERGSKCISCQTWSRNQTWAQKCAACKLRFNEDSLSW